jgi:hypothetical protein
MLTLACGLAGLAAFVLAGVVYAAARWTRERLDRVCRCYWCSSRREAQSGHYLGPGRIRAALGHLIQTIRLFVTR